LNENVDFDINDLPLQDPDVFVSGQINDHLFNGQCVLKEEMNESKISKWLME